MPQPTLDKRLMKYKTNTSLPVEKPASANDRTQSPDSDPRPMTISIVRQFARVYHPDERCIPAYGKAIYIN